VRHTVLITPARNYIEILMIGRTIGKYRILAPLGRGATGIVYKALDHTLDREVAIKILHPDLADSDIMRRFRAEATTLAKLNHPEIATVYELIHVEADLLMVMEFVRGETLEQLSDRIGPMPPGHAAYIVDRVLSALEHAHHAGIVHRDMKPANIMVTEAGGVKIMDFGIARVRGAERMTIDGGMMGTPAYMSPEQVLGQEVDGRADLYSVGVVLYRLLTNALPFSADNAIAMLQKQISETPTPLYVHRQDLPEWCDTIVQRALAKSPADRFQTAEAFREALGRATGMSTRIDLAKAFPLAPGAGARPRHAIAPETVALSAVDVLPESISGTAVVAVPDVRAPKTTSPGAARTSAEPIANGATIGLRKTYFAWSRSSLAAVAAGVAILGYLGLVRPATELTTPAPAKTFPVVMFQAKTIVGAGARQQERDARLILADGKVNVRAAENSERPLHAVPYEDVISISYSRGREPYWSSPKGPVRVIRIRQGFLSSVGISVEKHWISIQTSSDAAGASRFIVLHIDDPSVRRVLAALEERTGRTPHTIGRR
jgi:tRNA A-37 threonylcarbamoyl transferase component Bud32